MRLLIASLLASAAVASPPHSPSLRYAPERADTVLMAAAASDHGALVGGLTMVDLTWWSDGLLVPVALDGTVGEPLLLGGPASWDEITGVVPAADGWLLVGQRGPGPSETRPWTVSLNSDLSVRRQAMLDPAGPYTYAPLAAAAPGDGAYVATILRTADGRSHVPWVAHLDRDGHVLWARAFDIRVQGPASPLTATPDGVSLALDPEGSSRSVLLLDLDGAGDPLRLRSLETTSSGWMEVRSAAAARGGGVLLAGTHCAGACNVSTGWLARVEAGGLTGWTTLAEFEPGQPLEEATGGWLLPGSAGPRADARGAVALLGPDLSVESFQRVPRGGHAGLHEALPLPGATWAVGARSPRDGDFEGWLLRLDPRSDRRPWCGRLEDVTTAPAPLLATLVELPLPGSTDMPPAVTETSFEPRAGSPLEDECAPRAPRPPRPPTPRGGGPGRP